MKLNRRTLLPVVAFALALLAALLIFGRANEPGPSPAPESVPEAVAAKTSSAPTDTKAKREKIAETLSKPPEPQLASGAAGSAAPPDCQACREKECSHFTALGRDVLSGCFKQVDTSQGADANDPDFIADCTAVMQCAQQAHCTGDPAGPAACYCGSRALEDCIEHGPAADAPCVAQWQRAARTQSHEELSERFSDMKYPAGWAFQMIWCDQLQCSGKCIRSSPI
jgi:hypothetical protein